MTEKKPNVIVVGGGAAGMVASLFAARAGAAVTLLEKNEKLGKKVYITGKGRCNLTNDCDLDTFLSQVPRNPRFLYAALSFFSPQDMMALLESAGCPVTVQRGRRVFPASEKASDVTRALASLMRQSGVDVRLNTAVRSLETLPSEEGGRRVAAVLTKDGERPAASAFRPPVPPAPATASPKRQAIPFFRALPCWSGWIPWKPGPVPSRG